MFTLRLLLVDFSQNFCRASIARSEKSIMISVMKILLQWACLFHANFNHKDPLTAGYFTYVCTNNVTFCVKSIHICLATLLQLNCPWWLWPC